LLLRRTEDPLPQVRHLTIRLSPNTEKRPGADRVKAAN
jgi:hypothetical protein